MRAKTRQLHHGFFMNSKLGGLKPENRLLFSGLWTLADKVGHLEDDIKQIKAFLLPYDNGADCDNLLNELVLLNFIERYTYDNVKYIRVLNWFKYQNPHWNETESIIPDPAGHFLKAPRKKGEKAIKVSNKKITNKIKSNPDHQKAIDYFCEAYYKKFDIKYDFKGQRDGAIMKRLLKTYGLDSLKRVIDQLFITKDDFVAQQAGRTIPVLSACSNKLAQETSQARRMKIFDLREKLGRKPTEDEIAKI